MNKDLIISLKSRLKYLPESGDFIWHGNSPCRLHGKVAGTITDKGYIRITVNRQRFFAHRLAWLFVHGKFPENEIDHINQIKTDNRILNLKPATTSENQRNKPISKNNKSGFTGVYWHKKRKRWVAKIRVNGSHKQLGVFKDIKSAIESRKKANEIYGYSKNHGKLKAQ